ncbi:MAG: AzlD domain-containing protein [Dehalococcoidia bacterium]
MSWTAIFVLAAGAYAFKLAGVFGAGLIVPRRLERAVGLFPAALLPALAVVQTFSEGRALVLDERALGLAVAVALVVARAPLIAVMAAATALVRAL